MHGEIDLVLPAKRLVPRGRGFFSAVPRSKRDALDRLDGHAPFRANGGERLEVGRVEFVAHLDVAIGQEHRVECEPLEAAMVHPRDRQPMAGHADEPYEPLVARLDGSFESAVLA